MGFSGQKVFPSSIAWANKTKSDKAPEFLYDFFGEEVEVDKQLPTKDTSIGRLQQVIDFFGFCRGAKEGDPKKVISWTLGVFGGWGKSNGLKHQRFGFVFLGGNETIHGVNIKKI